MKLSRGINLGGYLSQCIHTEEHYETFITFDDIHRIAEMGFDHVRIPVDYNFFETEEGVYLPVHFKMLEDVIGECKNCGLEVVLDLHKAYGYDFNNAGDIEKNSLFTSRKLQDRFIALWEQLASVYGKYDHVALELLNEVVEEDNATLWNNLIRETVVAIRKHAPKSIIIYGGIQWNSAKTVKLLEAPIDENIMFTFHFYEPLLFTHQKAYWVEAMDKNATIHYPETMEYYIENSKCLGYQGAAVSTTQASDMGVPFFETLVSEAVEAANAAGVKLYCGEFGVIDQAPVIDSLSWFKDIDTVFRNHNIGCAVWSYKKMDFGITDLHYEGIIYDLLHLWTNK